MDSLYSSKAAGRVREVSARYIIDISTIITITTITITIVIIITTTMIL